MFYFYIDLTPSVFITSLLFHKWVPFKPWLCEEI